MHCPSEYGARLPESATVTAFSLFQVSLLFLDLLMILFFFYWCYSNVLDGHTINAK